MIKTGFTNVLVYEIVDTGELSLSSRRGQGTASAVSDTNDSARCVWVGIGRNGPAPTGSLT